MRVPRSEILGCEFDAVTQRQVLDWSREALAGRCSGWLSSVNTAILVGMKPGSFLKEFTQRSALTLADGQPIVWLSRLLGRPLPERVTGIDLVESLSRLARDQGKSVYLLGAKDEIVSKSAEHLSAKIDGLDIAGVRNGYFSDSEAETVAREIRRSGADIIFVGMGAPRQELFLSKYWDTLGVRIAVPVGGSFDVLSGLRKRAPQWMQVSGLEWFYRMIQEPRRLVKRYAVTNTVFTVRAVTELVAHRFRRA